MWAGWLQSPGLLWLLRFLLDHPSHCYVVLSWFAGGPYSMRLPFNCPALGLGRRVCVRLSTPRGVQHEKAMARGVTAVQVHGHGA